MLENPQTDKDSRVLVGQQLYHCHKIISRLSQNPRIKKSDLRFIGLACCGFSYAEIAFIMDYSPKYISNKRKSIAKKLGLNEPLLSYLEQETGSTLDSRDYQKQ